VSKKGGRERERERKGERERRKSVFEKALNFLRER